MDRPMVFWLRDVESAAEASRELRALGFAAEVVTLPRREGTHLRVRDVADPEVNELVALMMRFAPEAVILTRGRLES